MLERDCHWCGAVRPVCGVHAILPVYRKFAHREREPERCAVCVT